MNNVMLLGRLYEKDVFFSVIPNVCRNLKLATHVYFACTLYFDMLVFSRIIMCVSCR